MIPFRDNIPSRSFPIITVFIILINILAFLYELSLGPALEGFVGEFGVTPSHVLSWPGSDLTIAAVALPFLTSMFLHGGWLHWFLNSWALYQLGTLYETLFGSGRFALIYFVSGICASIASSMYEHGPAVGASGAIFGVLGAFIFSIYRSPRYRGQPWTRSLIAQLVFWIGLNLVIGFSIPHIDNVAHIGGLITGLLLGFLPHREPPLPPADSVIDVEPRYDHYGSE